MSELDKLRAIVNGEFRTIKVFLFPSRIIKFLKSEYNAKIGEVDTNGWALDFFIPVTINGTSYTIEGSIYNSDHCKFYENSNY